MNNWTFFATLYATIAVPLQTAINGLLTNVIDYIRAPLFAGITISIAMQAISVANGWANFASLKRHLLHAAVVVAVLQSLGTYNDYVVAPLESLPREISAALAGGGPNMADGAAYDLVWNQAAKAGLLVWEHIPSGIFKAAILALCVAAYFVVAICAIGGSFGVYVVSAILLKLLITIGPLFVSLYAFPGLRKFFNGWVSAVAGAMLTMILSVAVIALLIAGEMATINGIVQSATNGASANFVMELLTLLQAGFIMYFVYRLIKQVPSISIAIAGGVYQNVSSIASAPATGMIAAAKGADRVATAAGDRAGAAWAARRASSKPTGRSMSEAA